jgi:transposase-like protein
LPEECFEETYEKLAEIKEKADSEKENENDCCPHCASKSLVKNGKRRRKQAYLCHNYGRTFVETAGAAVAYSQSSGTVWKQVIRDTVEGIFCLLFQLL